MSSWWSKRPKNRINVPSGEHVHEVNHAFEVAKQRLLAVGAPVRDFTEVHVSFRRGDKKVQFGWGFEYTQMHSGNKAYVGGLTIGKIITLAVTPDNQPQHNIWTLEACHTWLRGVESDDYKWIKKAFPEWRI